MSLRVPKKEESPARTAVSPLNGSYADGTDVELTLFSAEASGLELVLFRV